jgi:hypothetical protein
VPPRSAGMPACPHSKLLSAVYTMEERFVGVNPKRSLPFRADTSGCFVLSWSYGRVAARIAIDGDRFEWKRRTGGGSKSVRFLSAFLNSPPCSQRRAIGRVPEALLGARQPPPSLPRVVGEVSIRQERAASSPLFGAPNNAR